MNIFYLDSDPKLCAQYHCDKHVVKSVLETTQILCTVIQLQQDEELSFLYAPICINNPCVKWAQQSMYNFLWLQQLGSQLAEEYTYRYDRRHKCQSCIRDIVVWVRAAAFPVISGLTVRPQLMPSVYKDDMDPRTAYRNYYLGDKTHLLKYTRRHVPDWVACMGVGEHK